MSFLKKLFGTKKEQDAQPEQSNGADLDSYRQIKWMTDSRLRNVATCLEAGFRPSTSLPTELGRQLRPSIEIARRLNAIKALVLWLLIPQENLESEKIMRFVDQNNLRDSMTTEEQHILNLPRDDEEARNAIGWKFENAWPLAWYFGYKEPGIMGHMMTGEQMQEILVNHTCSLEQNVEQWLNDQEITSENELINKEDLFYCLHNAVRSAQLGHETVPVGFDPVRNGGVIHERRHALTWMLSKDIDWEETDLST